MQTLFRITLLTTCLITTSYAGAQGSDMPTNFKIMMDTQSFAITSPTPPEREFSKYRPAVSLNDDELFKKSNRVIVLQVHWKYLSGVTRKVAGVLEMKVKLEAARENDVSRLEGIKQQLQTDFERELTKVGYSGAIVPFENKAINGRFWLKYQVPIIRTINYSTSLSDKRFLTVQFSFIDNTGEVSPPWYHEANVLIKKISESMNVE